MFVCMCVFIWVGTHIYAGVHVCVCTCTWRPEVNIGFLPQLPNTLLFKTGLALNLEFIDWPRLAVL